jgi:integrase
MPRLICRIGEVASDTGAPRNVARAFKALCQRSGVPEITLHEGRHTHTTTLIAAGVPIGVVSQRLGHSKVSTTMDIYAHVIPPMQAAATAEIERIYFADSPVQSATHDEALKIQSAIEPPTS